MAEPGLAVSLDVYRRMVGTRLRADLQYRTSFAVYLVAQAFVVAADLGAILAIFSKVDHLAGWSAAEVAFLYATSGLSFGLADLFVSPVEDTALRIKAGTFDQFLYRPVGVLWQVCGTDFSGRRIGRSILPVVALVVALTQVDVVHPLTAVVLLPVTVVSGVVIFGSVWVITASMAFWTVEVQEIANAFTYGGGLLTSYPVDVLGGWLRRFVVFVVPLASVVFLPAAGILGRPMPFGLPRVAAWSGPVVALAVALVARAIWGTALRHHRSTGS